MLKIGRVDYLNTLPLFFDISYESISEVKGSPAVLAEKLRKGEIDGGIISSIEYIINPDLYCVLPDISISSRGKICSVAIFSKKPLYTINSIYITPESLTSRLFTLYLLEYIYGVPINETDDPELADAVMLIGDKALKEFYYGNWEFVYDIAEEWSKLFELPFIFALFVFRKEVLSEKYAEIHAFSKEINKSLTCFKKYIKNGSVSFNNLPPDFIKEYLTNCIDYSLEREHLIALNRLREIASLYFPIKERIPFYTSCL